MVRQWQTMFYDKRYSHTSLDHPIDWMKLADAFGVTGMLLSETDDIESTLRKALAVHGPVVIDCEIPIDDMVLPMVAPGAGIEDVILSVDPIISPNND